MKASRCFSGRGYDWQMVLPDQRDHLYAVPAPGLDPLPKPANSRGATWAMQVYYALPYEFVSRTDLASDFWPIQVVQ